MLGLAGVDAARLVQLVEAGFAFARIESLRKATGLTVEEIGRFARIPGRTMTRRQAQGRLQADESDRVLRLATLFELATELFEGDRDAAKRWLETPQPGLGGAIPLEFAGTEVGAREVESLIQRLEHGVIS